jgi:selenocysteine lyase/cysteine desulfurase
MVSPENPAHRSGVISFTTDTPKEHYRGLVEAGYVISLRPAGIRVSTAFFNTATEVDGLIDEIRKLVG